MNQQEFIPESQDNEKPNTQSYSQYRTSDMPKRDHPADYSASIPAYSYQAQDTLGAQQQQAPSAQRSGARQRPQGATRQQAGTAQPPFSAGAARMQEQFRRQRENFFTHQNGTGQSSAPPYRGTRAQAVRKQNWLPIMILTALIVLALPAVLSLLYALFVVLLATGIFILVVVISLIIIYKFYFKKRWQRSRWRFW